MGLTQNDAWPIIIGLMQIQREVLLARKAVNDRLDLLDEKVNEQIDKCMAEIKD